MLWVWNTGPRGCRGRENGDDMAPGAYSNSEIAKRGCASEDPTHGEGCKGSGKD